MKDNQNILTSMLKTTGMGQTGLRAVLRSNMDPRLQKVLSQQLRAYDALEEEAQSLAEKRGMTLEGPDSMLQSMIEHMTWMKIPKRGRTSKIADMVIQGNTQGMIKTLRSLHRYQGTDEEVKDLNERLLSQEIQHIRQLKPFL